MAVINCRLFYESSGIRRHEQSRNADIYYDLRYGCVSFSEHWIYYLFMLTITSLAENFRKLDTDKVIQESFAETKDSFEKVQKEQLKAGKTKTGENIRPRYRNNKYARVKNEMNPLPGLGVPDLFLTGKFYSGIDAEPGKDVIDIISKDSKGPELEYKYPGIFGLGTNFKKQYLDNDLRPTVMGKISVITGLKI